MFELTGILIWLLLALRWIAITVLVWLWASAFWIAFSHPNGYTIAVALMPLPWLITTALDYGPPGLLEWRKEKLRRQGLFPDSASATDKDVEKLERMGFRPLAIQLYRQLHSDERRLTWKEAKDAVGTRVGFPQSENRERQCRFRFAMAIVAIGMLCREKEFLGSLSADHTAHLSPKLDMVIFFGMFYLLISRARPEVKKRIDQLQLEDSYPKHGSGTDDDILRLLRLGEPSAATYLFGKIHGMKPWKAKKALRKMVHQKEEKASPFDSPAII